MPLPFFLVVMCALIAHSGPTEAYIGHAPGYNPACGNVGPSRRREQLSGAYCNEDSDMCNPCGNKQPVPSKPDGGLDAQGALTSLAHIGFSILESGFFDPAVESVEGFFSGWNYIGAGILDGVLGIKGAGQDKAAWNRYKLENFISESTDYVVCEIKAIIGEYFKKYMDTQDLCHYNIGVNSMADVWMSSCHSRQCLNFTDLPADKRGDCCIPSDTAGNNEDCQSWSNEQIGVGQGFCRLQGEDFKPGSGVCSTDRVCMQCMDWQKAMEMTQAQIDRYQTSPTNWGEALQGYANIDAVVAQARGTMMMIAFYQELILLGGPAALGNFQLFAKNAHQQMQTKVDSIMASPPSVVEKSSCTLNTPVRAKFDSDCVWTCTDFCLFTRMGCALPYSMVGMNGCVDLGNKFCENGKNCTVCTESGGCNKLACYDRVNNDNPADFTCGSTWENVRQAEKEGAIPVLEALYRETLANVSRFLGILQNYSQEPLPLEVFGAYRRLGYRKPSCNSNTASPGAIAQCQHADVQSKGPPLPHSHFHP